MVVTRSKFGWIAVVVCLVSGTAARATNIPFGVASAYNVVALGVSGSSTLTGTIGTSSDIGGRVAAANEITVSTTIGGSMNSDPFGSQATYGVVSTNGLKSGETLNVNGGGNVYAPGTSGTIDFNDKGHRVTTGSSGINFSTLRTTLDNESTYLGTLKATGSNLGTGQAGYGNPSFYVLKGSSTTLNIFTVSASVFADPNHPLDIVTPPGSTTIINVTGATFLLNTGIYYNGQEYTGDSSATSNILFNLPNASSVTIDSELSASLLAPDAVLTGTGEMDGTLIAANVGQTGQINNVEFTGTLPSWMSMGVTPEPSSLVLLGSGLLALAGMTRMRRGVLA